MTPTEAREIAADSAADLTGDAMSPELMEMVADRIAIKLAERLIAQAEVDQRAVGVKVLCARFGLGEDWVRMNADALGGWRTGDTGPGKRPEYRFQPATVRERLTQMGEGPSKAKGKSERARKSKARRDAAAVGGVTLIPLREDIAA